MEKFKYKYSAAIIAVLVFISALSTGGLIWNIFSIIRLTKIGMPAATYYITAVINISLVALSLWITFGGRYTVTKTDVTLKIGPAKFTIKTSEIIKLVYFERAKKLFMLTIKGTATAVIIAQDKHDAFFSALKNANPAVIYETVSPDSEE